MKFVVIVALMLKVLPLNCHPLIDYTFIQAYIKYKYVTLDPNNYAKTLDIVEAKDTVLMIAVDELMVIGPAQIKHRYVKGSIDQMSAANITKLYEIKTDELKYIEFNPDDDIVTVSPDFGFFTMVNNIGKIFFDEETFLHKKFPIISKNITLNLGDKLTAVTISNGQLISKNIRIIDFKYCLKEFDPNELYTVDPDEQICTKIAFKPHENELPNTLLFAIREDNVYLIGNVSRVNKKYSLATIISKHCDNFIDEYGPHICQ